MPLKEITVVLVLETRLSTGTSLLGSEYSLQIAKSRSLKITDNSLKPSCAYHKINTFCGE